MLEAPLDAWYVWIGLAIVSSATFGVVSTLPSAPPPDASGAAETVDSVAASEYAAVGKHPLSNADAIRVGANSISVRGSGGATEHEPFGYAPVTPVVNASDLRPVLLGEPPQRVFDAPSEFEGAATRARAEEPEWQRTDGLIVRRVQWGEIDVVLVG